MDKILEFFVSIGEAIAAFFRFLISIVQDIVYLVKMLVAFVARIPEVFHWLPAAVSALLITLIGIYVIIRIAGKEG